MAIEKNPTPIPSARPADPMTAADGAQLFTKLDNLSKEIFDQVRGLSNRLAIVEGNFSKILDLLSRIDAGLSISRSGRVDAELRETEIEKDLVEKQLRAIEEKLNIKRAVKDTAIDTQERIQTVAASTFASLEDKKKVAREAKIEELKWGTLKAVVGALAVGGSLSLVGFLWWLFQQYVNRGGP